MRGAQQARSRSRQDQAVDSGFTREVDRGWAPGNRAVLDLQVLAAAEVVVARPHQQHEVPFVLESSLQPAPVVVDDADHADHRGRVNG